MQEKRKNDKKDKGNTMIIKILFVLILSYLIGSVPTGYIIVRLAKNQDIREIGSGSTGATNVKRVMGKKWFFIVMLLDAMKGALPVILSKVFLGDEYQGLLAVIASVGVIVGHSKSIFLKFSGGKSVASGVGTILALSWQVGLVTAIIWSFITYFSRYVSLGSIIALIISIMTYKRTESLRKEKIQEDANKFINKNSEEIEYIPLCLIANAYDNHHKYNRKIYNFFNLLSKDVQREVLKQLNYDCDIIKGNSWIDEGINEVRNFIVKNDLGADFLYDGAKYFYAAMDFQSNDYDNHCEYGHIMPDYFNWNPRIFFKEDKVYSENVTFFDYVDSYINAKANDPIKYIKYKDKKPLDVIAKNYNFGNCSEEELCYWLMQVVADIALFITREINRNKKQSLILHRGDAKLDCYEDRFLDVLIDLYNLDFIKNHSQSNDLYKNS